MNPGPQRTGSLEDVESLFRGSFAPRQALKPGFDLQRLLLLVLAATLGIYLVGLVVVLAIAEHTPFLEMYFLNPLATLETIGKLTLLISLALIGAYNAGVRREAVILLIIAQLIVVAGLLWLYFAFPASPMFPEHHANLLQNAILDGIPLFVLLMMVLVVPSRQDDSAIIHDMRSPASKLLSLLLLAYGAVFTALALMTIIGRAVFPPASTLGAAVGGPDPLLVNVVTEYATLGAVSFYLYSRSSLRKYFVPVVVLNLTVGAITSAVFALYGDTVIITRSNVAVRVPWLIPVHLLLSGVALALLLWMRRTQYRVDYQITALGPSSAECVMSLHQAFRETSQKPRESVRDILQRIDEYIVGIRGKQRGIIAFPFWMVEHILPALAGLRPPFSTMSRDQQRWMLRRYVIRPNYERSRAVIPALADAMFMVGDSVHSLLTFAFFSSSGGQANVGYILPNARERLQPDIAVKRPPEADQPTRLPENLNDPVGRKPAGTGMPFLITPRVSVPDPPHDLPSH